MKKVLGLSLLLTSSTFINCADDDPIDPATVIEAAKTEFVANYVNIVEASYDDALAKAKDLKTAIDAFTKAPDATKFQKAKEAWLDSREPYGQTEAYRFYDGPIDGANGEPEGYINAWPLDEGLIDYVTAGTSGSTKNLINDTSFNLTKTSIKELSGNNNNESNVTIGYHAIEFLLWGQDSTAPSEKKAGKRAYTDYTTAANADRRKQYLQLAAEILVDDLESVVKQWKPRAAYRKQFLALSKNDAIDKILTGAAKLSKGELAGERMATAVEKQDQEEEHSCFSDNTHRDIYLNALSINNIIHGTYKRIDGSTVTGFSLLDLLLLVNATESATLKTTSEVVMTKVKAISDAKFFDYQIIGEALDNNTKPVMATVFSLRKQGDQLAQSGKTITGKIIDASVE
ncbi:imelysin family protein [Tenacibaculum maritimum]|uniref:imelysin family protein n=1 Tax=Tenacibaculum maritimum TaxID=107401 RepID=UPI0012E5A95C|nr:imelysin family protein [Tenacibaculum maritimum]CAA0246241.1 Probable lipoprotein precursor. Putative iron-regulated protein [Tenacibaculum maritimum]